MGGEVCEQGTQKKIPLRWKGNAIRLVRDSAEVGKGVGGGREAQEEETLTRCLKG